LLIFATCLLAQDPTIEQQKERWNKVFAGSVIPFNRQPNAFLLKSVQGKIPGTALEIGMGQGRNTIAIARLGWDVTGIDISDEGIRQAVAEAKKQNLTIHAILASADDFDYGTARYNLICATFEHQLITDNAAKIVAALKPDGMVVIEGFQEDVSKQVGFQLGHQVNELPIVRFVARKQQK
jgi:2-polyprenyl-3-methyl-5-hydroxy-6-metoxy-1,4-benzoquinol methylase